MNSGNHPLPHRGGPIAPPPKPAAETAPPPVDNAAAIQAKTDIVSRTVSPQRQAPHLEATADGGPEFALSHWRTLRKLWTHIFNGTARVISTNPGKSGKG